MYINDSLYETVFMESQKYKGQSLEIQSYSI